MEKKCGYNVCDSQSLNLAVSWAGIYIYRIQTIQCTKFVTTKVVLFIIFTLNRISLSFRTMSVSNCGRGLVSQTLCETLYFSTYVFLGKANGQVS